MHVASELTAQNEISWFNVYFVEMVLANHSS